MPYHLMLDTAGETRLGKHQIGTTRRGIGPCYADKAARLGIRVQDLLDEKILKKKIVLAMEPKRQSLRPFAKAPELDLQAMTERTSTYGHRIEQYITDTARSSGTRWTAAATSSSRAPRARCSTSTTAPIRSSPLQPGRRRGLRRHRRRPAGHRRDLGRHQGLRHPRRRRPVPDRARRRARRHASARPGGEYGTTTGRARRVGWIDLVALRYAVRLNTMTAPRDHQARRAHRPRRPARVHRLPRRRGGALRRLPVPPDGAAPGHGRVRGAAGLGRGHLRGAREADLPQTARDYLAFLADFIGVPIALVGVGPGRDQVDLDRGRPRHRRRPRRRRA